MVDVFRSHLVTNLRFFARSRLILGCALVVVGIWLLELIPFFLFDSSGQRLNMLVYVSSQLHDLGWFCGAGLALVAMTTNLRGGATRLLFTRPSPPEVWIASIFAAAFVVAVSVHVLAELVVVGLSLAWKVPYQIGFLYISIEYIFETLIVVSLMAALSALVHPVLAVLMAVVLNDAVIYSLRTMLMSARQASPSESWLSLLEWPLRAFYVMLPMLDPFSAKMQSVREGLRVTPEQWMYLGLNAGYALLVAAFFFFLSTYRLRRRPMLA